MSNERRSLEASNARAKLSLELLDTILQFKDKDKLNNNDVLKVLIEMVQSRI